MEYTKGEWIREGNKIIAFGRGTIAICPSPTTNNGVVEFIANANLIAQSPRMYGLLKRLADWDAGKFGKESNTRIIEISKSASKIIAELET